MQIQRGERYYELDQFLGCYLGQDWGDEFDGPYEAAEFAMGELSDESLNGLVSDIDILFATVRDPGQRRRTVHSGYAFGATDDFDAWLRAVRERAAEAVAGIHSHPLTDPAD